METALLSFVSLTPFISVAPVHTCISPLNLPPPVSVTFLDAISIAFAMPIVCPPRLKLIFSLLCIATVSVSSQSLYIVIVQPFKCTLSAVLKAVFTLSKYLVAIPETPEMLAVNWNLQTEHTPVSLSTSV